MNPPFPSKYKAGEWVEFHFQDDGARRWGLRWGQIAETDFWPYDPSIREQPDEWGYRMEGDSFWVFESDLIRKLSLLEIIAEVS